MLIKPFKQLIEDYHRKKEAQEYDGFVEDNNDPKLLGRIRVRTELYDDVESSALPWCYPTPPYFLGNSKNSIMFSVPEIGSQVKVYYPTHDKTTPFYKGMEFNELNKCTFFEEDYPNTYGFKDSRGNFYIVNKAKDITQYQHSSGTNIKIESDGTYTITTPDGSYIYSDCNGNMRMCGTTLTVNMTESINLNAPSINVTGTGNSGEINLSSTTIQEVALDNHTISGNVNNIYSGSDVNIRCNNGNGMTDIVGSLTTSKKIQITTQDLNVLLGNINVLLGNISVTGGNVGVNGGDVTADGISLKGHTHLYQIPKESLGNGDTSVPH